MLEPTQIVHFITKTAAQCRKNVDMYKRLQTIVSCPYARL